MGKDLNKPHSSYPSLDVFFFNVEAIDLLTSFLINLILGLLILYYTICIRNTKIDAYMGNITWEHSQASSAVPVAHLPFVRGTQ